MYPSYKFAGVEGFFVHVLAIEVICVARIKNLASSISTRRRNTSSGVPTAAMKGIK